MAYLGGTPTEVGDTVRLDPERLREGVADDRWQWLLQNASMIVSDMSDSDAVICTRQDEVCGTFRLRHLSKVNI